jgi:hypothetical protein
MTVSLIDVIKENLRQQSTNDDSFYKAEWYYFKLVTSAAAFSKSGVGKATLFPLPIGPELFEYTLPFAAEVTATEDGGAVAEENGIVVGQMVLEGTTGWKLKKARDTSISSGNGNFTGQMPKSSGAAFGTQAALSGQMLLWRLIGRCFDAYGELKKDPTLAHKTHMEFHSLKDQLHVRVVPRVVKIKRDKGTHRVTYGYTIQCDVLGKADLPSAVDKLQLSDDTSILDSIKNGIYLARKYTKLLGATIDDLTACMGDIKRYISNIAGIVNDCTQILNACTDFLEGVKSFMDIPAEFMSSVGDLVDAAVVVADTWNDFPDKGKRVLKDLEDTLDGINFALKNNQVKQWDERCYDILGRLQQFGKMSDVQLAEVSAAAVDGAAAAGTKSAASVFAKGGNLPGDSKRAEVEDIQPTVTAGQYTGFYETTVKKGDTIQSIAAAHLGDPSQWKALAMVNRLKSPFIAGGSVRKARTLAVGDPIAIPTTTPSGAVNSLTGGNASAGGSQISVALGVDIRTVKLANGKYGWAEDTPHGSTDVQVSSGINNLVQGLEARMRREQGQDPHFPNCGLPRLVGNDAVGQSFREARFAMEVQLLQDPRIEAVERLEFDLDRDSLVISADARVVGLDSSRTIPVTVS